MTALVPTTGQGRPYLTEVIKSKQGFSLLFTGGNCTSASITEGNWTGQSQVLICSSYFLREGVGWKYEHQPRPRVPNWAEKHLGALSNRQTLLENGRQDRLLPRDS